MNMYVIKDVVVGKFHTNQITMMNNDQEAIRALKQMGANVKPNDLAALDLQLWRVGSFDESTGLITDNIPELIGSLPDYIKGDVLNES